MIPSEALTDDCGYCKLGNCYNSDMHVHAVYRFDMNGALGTCRLHGAFKIERLFGNLRSGWQTYTGLYVYQPNVSHNKAIEMSMCVLLGLSLL